MTRTDAVLIVGVLASMALVVAAGRHGAAVSLLALAVLGLLVIVTLIVLDLIDGGEA